MRPGSQKRATRQRESIQSCDVIPKDASREEEHRTVWKIPTERRCRGCRWSDDHIQHPGKQPQRPGRQRSGLCAVNLGNALSLSMKWYHVPLRCGGFFIKLGPNLFPKSQP